MERVVVVPSFYTWVWKNYKDLGIEWASDLRDEKTAKANGDRPGFTIILKEDRRTTQLVLQVELPPREHPLWLQEWDKRWKVVVQAWVTAALPQNDSFPLLEVIYEY